VAAKPRHALSSLTRPQGVVGAVSGLAPGIERKLTFDGRRLGSWTRKTFTGLSYEAVLDPSADCPQSRESLERSGRLTANRQRRQRLGWAGCARQKTPRHQHGSNPSQPALAS